MLAPPRDEAATDADWDEAEDGTLTEEAGAGAGEAAGDEADTWDQSSGGPSMPSTRESLTERSGTGGVGWKGRAGVMVGGS